LIDDDLDILSDFESRREERRGDALTFRFLLIWVAMIRFRNEKTNTGSLLRRRTRLVVHGTLAAAAAFARQHNKRGFCIYMTDS